MSVRLLSELDEANFEASAQICVVGAGIAGLFAACRLAEKGYKVSVLESGGRKFDQQIHDLNEVEDAFGSYTGARNGRYRGLGGSSSHWGGRMLPLTTHDARARPYAAIDAWPFDIHELNVYRREIEQVFGIDDASFEEEALDLLDRQGVIPRGDPDIALRYPKWPTFRHCNVANVLRDRIEAAGNLEIWLGATACGFKMDRERGRLSGIVARDFFGRTICMHADEFVFAAGTIEVTRLLLHLDAACDGRAFEKCRVLGRYFQDHLNCSVGTLVPHNHKMTNVWFGYHFIAGTRRSLHMELTPQAQEAAGVASAFAQVLFDPAPDSALNVIKKALRGLQRGELDLSFRDGLRLAADFGVLLRTGYWRYVRRQLFLPSELHLNLSIWTEQVPNRQNKIALSDRKDRFGCPLVRVEWWPGEADERTFRACIARVRAYWERSGLNKICPIAWSPAALDEHHALLEGVTNLGHPAGSTRMGTDPVEAVVGPDLRCHHISNVTVASASVFPSPGSANPTYTIIQLALRAADAIALRLGRTRHYRSA